MAPRSKAANARSIKSEAIKANGVLTPNSSMTSGTLAPKLESIEIPFPDISEGVTPFSHDGLPLQFMDDEGYQTQTQHKVRSDAPSIQTSRQPSLSREGRASMEALQAPGASLQMVGEKLNLLISHIEKLRQLGLGHELSKEIPELVLVGDQSAGKSTLMSAIAEIQLPKGDGMCTRCPANIKTSPAKIWSCSISLHQYYDFTRDKPSPSKPFAPWRAKLPQGHMETTPFKTITQKSELEEVLRYAQYALLNPSDDPKLYIPGTGAKANGIKADDKHEADFSPNLIAIEISGPKLPALSFYDLPGIFLNWRSEEEKYLVDVFENLAKEYIARPNALVICAMAMHNDPGTSKTFAIVKTLKAEDRCVGVLTKSDRLEGSSVRHEYDALLRGDSYKMKQGYFVTKQPGPDFKHNDHEDYHHQARREENEFFDSNQTWSGEWSIFRDRCGTSAIQEYLSRAFANEIIKSMPVIMAKVEAQTKEVENQLSDLPELPAANVQHVVRAQLQEFSNGVRKLFDGGRGFLSAWSQLSIEFRDSILEMKPMFQIADPSDIKFSTADRIEKLETPESITIDSDDEMPPPRSSVNKRHLSGMETPTAKRVMRPPTFQGTPPRFNLGTKQEGSSVGSAASPYANRRVPPGLFNDFAGSGKGFMSIADIRAIIREHELPGRPDHVDDAAKEFICLKTVKRWDGPLEILANYTFKLLRESVLSVLDDKLRHWKMKQLYRSSREYIIDWLAHHEEQQRQQLQILFKQENYKMFTINTPAFETYKLEELKNMTERRTARRWKFYVTEQERKGKKFTDREEKAVDLEKLGLDPFHNEVDLAAYVRGYYKVASLRFTDVVCLNIQCNIFAEVAKGILGFLETSLELNEGDGEQKCRNLMAQNNREAEKRANLQLRKHKLIQAAETLAELVRKFEAETSSEDGHNHDPMDGDRFEVVENHDYPDANVRRTPSPDTNRVA